MLNVRPACYLSIVVVLTILPCKELALFSYLKKTFLAGDEICDNGIDDDLDGLIDLNDPDCDCPLALPTSLIPNPSFEDKTCCPQDRSQLNCAVDWIQASEATTDYLHTCGWMGWTNLPPPLPFPDGDGCIGWRNGRPAGGGGQGGPVPNWKEYAGSCLTGPLKAGVSYRFEFYVGFTRQPNSPGTTIAFFGSTNCNNLPFGIGNENFGCPTNGIGWMQLGSVPISGTFEWQKKEINVTPTVDIHAIAIGPNCTPNNTTFQPYYFFDNLVLASFEDFGFRIATVNHPCSDELSLKVQYQDTLSYQWYKNGIALPGETSNILSAPPGAGKYQVRMLGTTSCLTSEVFNLIIPTVSAFVEATICEGDSYFFNDLERTQSGLYIDTLRSVDNCDSIIYLELEVLQPTVDTVQATIFAGENYVLENTRFSNEGEHLLNLSSTKGCDSLVLLILDFYEIFIPNSFSPNFDGFNDVFTVFSNKQGQTVKSMEIFNRWGGLVYAATNLLPNDLQYGWDGFSKGQLAEVGTYVYKVVVTLQDGQEKEFTGPLVLVR